MTAKELAKNLIEQIPEEKMYYIIAFLQGAAVPTEKPNADTIAAIKELEEGCGKVCAGSTAELFAELMEG